MDRKVLVIGALAAALVVGGRATPAFAASTGMAMDAAHVSKGVDKAAKAVQRAAHSLRKSGAITKAQAKLIHRWLHAVAVANDRAVAGEQRVIMNRGMGSGSAGASPTMGTPNGAPNIQLLMQHLAAEIRTFDPVSVGISNPHDAHTFGAAAQKLIHFASVIDRKFGRG